MFCHHCGSQIAEDATTCIHCGVATAPTRPPPRAATPGMAYCRHCGAQIARAASTCVHCGVRVGGALDPMERALFPAEGRSWVVALLLAGFLGYLGVHRFYVGKILTGILMFITGGGLGIWWIIDVVRIALGLFDDADGRPLVR